MLAASLLFSQGTPLPYTKIQFFSNNGQPLALGALCTFDSGTSTPRATFSDYLLTVPNPQCVPLDSAGRAAIWMDSARVYRAVLKDSTGVTIWTQDGIPGSGSGILVSGGTLWSQNGTTVYNSSGNRVCIASSPCLTALSVLNVAGSSAGGSNNLIRIDDTSNSPGVGLFGSGAAMGFYTANAAGLQLRSPDNSSQLSVAQGNVMVLNGAASGGTTLNVKASTTQSATPLMQWQTSSGSNVGYVDATGNLVMLTMTANGTLANTIGAPNGGITGQFLIATDSLFLIAEPQPALSGAGQARIYLDNGTNIVNASINGGAYAPFGGGGGGGGSPGGPTTAIQFNSSGSFSGTADLTWASNQLSITGTAQSTLGFNSTGTATNTIQAASGGMTAKWLIATDSHFWVEEAAPAVSAGGQAKIYADSGTHQLMMSKNGATFARVASNAGALTNGNCAQFNSTGDLVDAGGPCTTGGGGGTVTAGLAQEVAYYPSNGTSVAGSTFFFWNNSTRLLTVNASSSAAAGMAVANGYMQADAGFLATSSVATAYNSFYAPTAGMAGLSFTAVNYVQAGNHSGTPTATTGDSFHSGALYWDTSTHTLKVFNDSSAWQDVGSGAGGTPGGADTNIQYNGTGSFAGSANFLWTQSTKIMQVNDGLGNFVNLGSNFINAINSGGPAHALWSLGITSSQGALRLSDGTGSGGFDGSGAQIYGTAFNGLMSAHEYVASNTGSAFTFANTNSNFLVSGDGAVSAVGIFASTGGSGGFNVTANGSANSIQSRGGVNVGASGSGLGAYQVNGSTVINSTGQFIGPSVVSGSGSFSGVVSAAAFTTTGFALAPLFTGVAGASLNLNGHFTGISAGTVVVNDTSAAGGSITISHGGSMDALWQAGGSGSSATVFDATTSGGVHNLIVYQNGHIQSANTSVPGISGTGCSMGSGSNDLRGRFTCTGGSSATVTFANAYTSQPHCVANNLSTGTTLVAVTTTVFQVVFGATPSTFDYICLQ